MHVKHAASNTYIRIILRKKKTACCPLEFNMKSNRWVGNETTRSRSNPVFCNTTRTTNENLVKQHLISQEKDRRDECDEEVKQEQPGGDTPQRLLPLSLWCWPWQTPIPAPHHASSLSHRSVKQPAWQKSALIHPSPVCFHSNPIQVCFGSRAGEGWQFGFGCVDVFFLLHVLIDRCDIVAWEHSRLPVVRSFPPVGVGVVQHLDKSTAAEAWLAVLLCVEVKQRLWNVTERRKRQKRGHREDTEWTMHILSMIDTAKYCKFAYCYQKLQTAIETADIAL